MPKQLKRSPKPKKHFSLLARALLLLLLLGGLAALSTTVLFPLRECKIVGQSRYSAQDYAAAMELATAQLNLFRADKAALVRKIHKALPYARVSRASRTFPNAMKLYVQDAQPAFAQQEEQSQRWWLISDTGRLLELAAAPPKEAIAITGLPLQAPVIGQTARWQGSRATGQGLTDLLGELRGSALGKQVTGLRITSGPMPDAIYQDRLRLRFGAPPPNIGSSAAEVLGDKMRLAEQTIASLNKQNPQQRGVLDLTVVGQAYFSAEWDARP